MIRGAHGGRKRERFTVRGRGESIPVPVRASRSAAVGYSCGALQSGLASALQELAPLLDRGQLRVVQIDQHALDDRPKPQPSGSYILGNTTPPLRFIAHRQRRGVAYRRYERYIPASNLCMNPQNGPLIAERQAYPRDGAEPRRMHGAISARGSAPSGRTKSRCVVFALTVAAHTPVRAARVAARVSIPCRSPAGRQTS